MGPRLCLLILLSAPACASSPERIVSVGGALTETIYALGAQARLVGSDTTSYYPPAAERLPKVGYQRALSAEGILSLNPDSIFVTEAAGPAAVLEQIKMTDIAIHRFPTPRDVHDVKSNVEKIARLLRRQSAAESLLATMDAKYAELRRRVGAVAAAGGTRRVLFLLQHGGGPALVSGTGTAADTVMALAGVENAASDFARYKPLTPEAAAVLKPDFLLVTRRGLAQAGGEETLLQTPGIALTPAAGNGRVVVMDALLLLGLGPRTVDAALELHSRVYAR